MPEGEGARMKQFCYLFYLVLRLKAWKFLFWILLGPLIFMNYLLYHGIENEAVGDVTMNGITELTLSSVLSHKTIIKSNTPEQKDLMQIIQGRGGSPKEWIENCDTAGKCMSRFVQSAVSGSDRYYSFLNYGTKSEMAMYCLGAGKAQIMCPFLYHAMSLSMEVKTAPAFKDVTFAKFTDNFEVEKGTSLMNASRPPSMCTNSLKNGKFLQDGNFLMYTLGHVLLLGAAFILNFTVGTLASMSNLKENGFLQLVFNSGLSVGVYWLVYWLLAILECLVFASLVIVSYTSQCPGFYNTDQLVTLFFAFFGFFLTFSALGFLFATLVSSFFIVLLLMILLQIVVTVQTLMVMLLVFSDKKDEKVGMMSAMLVFPPGHLYILCLRKMLPTEMFDLFKEKKDYHPYLDSIAPSLIAVPIGLMIFTIYLDFIVKSGNGLCLPLCFPFNPNFWNPHRQKLIEMVDNQPRQANVEPTIGVPAVIATDIFMTYPSGLCGGKGPTILKGVTCTIYQGQITGLIGHNGAGKTTLIRVLMGEEFPTSGVAVINGHRVTDPYQRLALRGSVSICKQVDVLSNYLTVMESMKLTLVAKGFSVDSQVSKVLDMMKRLGLAGKENVQAMDLSGGQMRKVCSILCLLGNPKLVILDEPTSGLDPVSRRNLWQVLQDHKAGRSILLCTQFMDEADILADRKMFLSAGKLICAGSSIFLKHAFGCCASINVSLKSAGDTNRLMKLLKKVKLISQIQTEVVLQVAAEKPQVLADAIQTLEDHPEIVDAFGVSQAQLDDIFMRLKFIDMDNIEASFKSKKLRKLGRGKDANTIVESVDFSALYNPENRKPINSTPLAQFTTLVGMNLQRQWKAKIKFCFRILFPLLLVVAIALLSNKISSDEGKPPEKKVKKAADEADSDSGLPKTFALTNVNETLATKNFFLPGFCISDKGAMNETDDLMALCREITQFPMGGLFKEKAMSVQVFIKQDGTQKLLRKYCPPSADFLAQTCFFVYASSWSQETPNKDRTIYIGTYENKVKSPPDATAQITYYTLRYYEAMAKYFSLHRETGNRNLSLGNTYVAQTFSTMTFTNFEVFIYVTVFALIPVTYMNDPIEDKDCGVRQALVSMGMSTMAYWVNTFILHWMHYAISFVLASLACLPLERYRNSYFFINLMLPVLFLGTTTSQLCVYVISALLKKTNAIVLVMYFFFAMFLGIIVGYIQSKDTMLLIVICVLPQAAPVAYLVLGMKVLVYSLLVFKTNDASKIEDLGGIYLSSDKLMICLGAMGGHILILIVVIILIENPDMVKNMCARKVVNEKDVQKPVKDEGVKLEADRINKTIKNENNMLEVRDLQKVYPNGVRAVRGTTFGVFAGEILGLLGPNGAGKTTSMSIIVGEEEQSGGASDVNFGGTWMSGSQGANCGAIGYCPQHNPLFNSISVFEHIRFYAQIRGLPPELAKAQIAGLIDGLGLKPHQAKAAEQLSGGNKRRLCLAIALLGNPALVVIDEASTGVDPENKRFIWSAIRGMASKYRSVMITTHSMEEVEALCSRVGIMNKGVMIGFGTVQQLRSRHGEAYTLDILLKAKKPQKVAAKKKKLIKKLAKQFKNAVLMEDLMRSVQFNLPRKSVPSFSGAMRWFITKKKSLGMQYFSLYQMSLDQVFVKLVKEYDES